MPDGLGQDSLIGRELGHYRLIERIGEGGMGVVYRAQDEHLDREVAIKVLPQGSLADDAVRQRFRKEAHALSKLNHPNIATVHDFDSCDGNDYLAEELIAGVSLDEKLATGPLSEREIVDLGTQLCEGLAVAHERGIIHRDIKPGNIRVTPDGRLKILDFGLAKTLRTAALPANLSETLSETQVVTGTLPYISPEQLRNEKLDGRTDIWATGCVLYEMATSRRPFVGQGTALLNEILTRQPVSPAKLNPRIAAGLGSIILKCLEKDASLRYGSAREVAVDLRRLLTAPATVAKVPVGSRKRWKILAPAALMLVAAVIGGRLYFGSQRVHALTVRDTIVLSDFTNKTGDAIFDDTLKQGLSVQLEQSPFLALVSDRKVNDALKLMGRQAGDRLTPDVTREVCQRTGSKAMVTGAIAGLGSRYVIGLKAVICDTGDVLAETQEQAEDKETVLKALDNAAVTLRSKLGESLSSVDKYATPLQEATTPSLEALKAYSLGVKAGAKEATTASLPLWKRAVELDPNFAMAYLALGGYYFNENQGERGSEYVHKAYALREKVSERERLQIEVAYYLYVTGELEKVAQTAALWRKTYPRDGDPVGWLGMVWIFLGDWEKALNEIQESMRLDPNTMGNYVALSEAYQSLNRLDEAEAVYKQADERKIASELLLANRYLLAFLKGDATQMANFVSTAQGTPGAEDLLLAAQADTEGWYGKLKSAHELTRKAMDSAQRNDARESAAAYQAAAALREAGVGNRGPARAEANAAIKLAPNRDVRAIAALALAQAGDTVGAEKLAAELDEAHPLDTLVQRYWLPTIRAGVALERNDPKRAIDLLKVASTIELGEPANLQIYLCPVYLRGRAYLMLHDGSGAAAEFQKFIDHRGLVANFPWGALARLGVARAYAMQGDLAKARTSYQDFLALWKDADPDIPILKQAKAEFANLIR